MGALLNIDIDCMDRLGLFKDQALHECSDSDIIM